MRFASIYFPLEKFPLSLELDINCVHCPEIAQSEEESENGSNLEDLNALCDILAKLSATL